MPPALSEPVRCQSVCSAFIERGIPKGHAAAYSMSAHCSWDGQPQGAATAGKAGAGGLVASYGQQPRQLVHCPCQGSSWTANSGALYQTALRLTGRRCSFLTARSILPPDCRLKRALSAHQACCTKMRQRCSRLRAVCTAVQPLACRSAHRPAPTPARPAAWLRAQAGLDWCPTWMDTVFWLSW